jgi:hypothetical protein
MLITCLKFSIKNKSHSTMFKAATTPPFQIEIGAKITFKPSKASWISQQSNSNKLKNPN